MRHAIFLACLLLGGRAAAHPLDLGILRIDARDGRVSVVLELEVGAARQLAATDEALADATYGKGTLGTDRGLCRWTAAHASRAGNTVSLAAEATCPDGATTLSWELPFLAELPATFQLLVQDGGVTLIDREEPRLTLAWQKAEAPRLAAMVWDGVRHIGAAPEEWRGEAGELQLPDGIDHILFLLALLLAGGTLLQLVGVATGFTVGHTVTLILAGLGVVRPPASIIEPLVALTIAAAAVEAITGRLGRHRWKIATGFGAIHGFAFAGALFQVSLSTEVRIQALFAYNLGVELGQVAIILCLAPSVLLLYRRPRLARVVVRILAGAIFLAGMYWFFARAF